MQIITQKGKYNVIFDVYGNLYFQNDKIYCLEINGRNEPTLEETLLENTSVTQIQSKKFEVTTTSLKQLIQDEVSELDDDNEEEEPDYYPEDSNIIQDVQEDDDLYNTTVNESFEFSTKNNNETVQLINYEDGIFALYDTYIYHEETLHYKTNYIAEVPALYRIRLYTNGDMYIRPIGYAEKLYKLDDLLN